MRLDAADAAQRTLIEASSVFNRYWKPGTLNVSQAGARALDQLVQAARVFAARSDEEWAGQVADLRSATLRMWQCVRELRLLTAEEKRWIMGLIKDEPGFSEWGD